MPKNPLKRFYLFFMMVLNGLFAQSIHLINVPYTLIPVSETIRVTWQEDLSATLYYGKNPTQLNQKLNISGTQRLDFVPNAVNMQPGRYYGKISNGALSSSTFMFAVETNVTPSMKLPQNNSVVREPAVQFIWDAVNNVPYYHVLVTDREAKITQAANGDMQLEGANVIWQAITPELSIRYGMPDPSGYFNDFNRLSPPLMQGRKYQWAVLNCYGNHPSWSSTAQSGLSGFSMQYANMIAAANLIAPVSGAAVTSRSIEFTWNAVSNVHHYELYLFEEIVQDQSKSTYPIYHVVTESNHISMDAHELLKSGAYFWSVLAGDQQGRVVASEFRPFRYGNVTSELHILTKTIRDAPLPRTSLGIRAIDGSNESASILSTESGQIFMNLQAGLYEIHASKPGFADTTRTVRIEAGESIQSIILLRPDEMQLSGEVLDKSGKAVEHAVVNAYEAASGRRMKSDVLQGQFIIGLTSGQWLVWGEIHQSNFTDTLSVTMTASKKLSAPLRFLSDEFTVSGQVQSSNGKTIGGAKIIAGQAAKTVQTISDQTGQFSMALSSGQWSLQAMHSGYVSSGVRSIAVSKDQTVSTPFVIGADGVQLNGIVYSGDTGVKDARIMIYASTGYPVSAQTDARGNFSVTLEQKVYRLYATAQDYLPDGPLLLDMRTFNPASPIVIHIESSESVVWGVVKNSTGQMIENAIVSSSFGADTTGMDGVYRLPARSGKHQLYVNKAGYALSKKQTVQISKNEEKHVDLTLSADVGTIQGYIRSLNGAIACADLVAVKDKDTTRVCSDPLGNFSLSLMPGLYQLTARAAGYLQAVRPVVTITSGQMLKGIDFQLLENTGVVRGTVRGISNQPASYVEISAGPDGLKTWTDLDGKYSLVLDAGAHQLHIQKSGYQSQIVQISTIANQSLTKNIDLIVYGRITGQIKQTNGTPIWDAEVTGISQGDSITTRSDHVGYYTLTVPQGQYQIVYDQLGYDKQTKSWSFATGAAYEQNIQLKPNPSEISSIKGKVMNSSGQSLSGVLMQLQGNGATNASTESDGTFMIERLETGYTMKLTPVKAGHFFIPVTRDYKPLNGHKTLQNFKAGLYGDVSGNDKVSSFDGSLVLRVSAGQNPSPNYQDLPRDSIAADVSGNGVVSAFDGSLIFRYSVGLIAQFPIEEKSAGKASDSAPSKIMVIQEVADHDTVKLVLHFEDGSAFYAMDVQAAYPEFEYMPCPENIRLSHSMQSAFRFENGQGQLSLGTVEAIDAKSFTCEIPFVRLKKSLEFPPVILVVSIDERKVEIQTQASLPTDFQLMSIAPNPFNSQVMICLFVPESQISGDPLTINIYNIIGQRVREITYPISQAGFHQIIWNGRNGTGQDVASGVYLLEIHAANIIRKKIVCVR